MLIFASVEEIYQSLDRTRNKLIEAISILNETEANFRPTPEKWSATLIVEHLAKTEANLVRVVKKLLGKAEAANAKSDGKINPPISFAETAEKIRGERLEAPAFIAPEGAASIADSLKQLAESRRALLELRARIEAVDGSNAEYPHPFFGQFNLYQWLAFIGLHERHHLRQIRELIKAQAKQNFISQNRLR